ncbi:hypothetical protein COR50_14060 [Chitinophaga caeni]|uniref:Uncharacterized protein n=1 Tax=Chitinophaga caeni TaxID=2029983 RepID=A0A291QW79_9BACT|nr:hypothetical protein [Chitinophaga caeni]ATL48195.1 hypothetical protein COR50_14060 [Chitinophaga caeni]
MSKLELINIFYRQNKDIPGYMDIFFETNFGVLKYNITSLDFRKFNEFGEMNRGSEIDNLRNKYGKLYIDEVRITYDSNMYLLISGKFILAIEYILNLDFKHSVQEFRIIEDIYGANKTDFEDFKELDIIELPSLSV